MRRVARNSEFDHEHKTTDKHDNSSPPYGPTVSEWLACSTNCSPPKTPRTTARPSSNMGEPCVSCNAHRNCCTWRGRRPRARRASRLVAMESVTKRRSALERLRNEQFDVLVVGGGITGAGVALDAAARGLRTALIDQSDFAAGTSSKSSKLIHGGLRYLQQGDVALVYEALHERQRLLRNAPHLVRMLPFMIPVMTRDASCREKLPAHSARHCGCTTSPAAGEWAGCIADCAPRRRSPTCPR